jgi:hypothetical protein
MKWTNKTLWKKLWKTPTFDNIPLKRLPLPGSQEAPTTTQTMDTNTTSPSPETKSSESETTSTIIAGTIRPLEIEPGNIYQISQQQFNSLWNGANREGMAFMVPYPRFVDTPQHAQELLALCQEFEDLLALNLLVDVSTHYSENVEEAWNEHGRQVRFMHISKLGELMFKDGDKRPVN